MRHVLQTGQHLGDIPAHRLPWDLVIIDGRAFVVVQVFGDPDKGEILTAMLRRHPRAESIEGLPLHDEQIFAHARWLGELVTLGMRSAQHVLMRTQADADFRHIAGPRTETFRFALETEAAGLGRSVEQVEPGRSQNFARDKRTLFSAQEVADNSLAEWAKAFRR